MIVKDLDSLEVIKHELGMNISELAEFLNVSRPTIYKWDKEGIPESKKPMVRFKLSRHRPYGVPDLVSMVQENTAYYINKNGNTFEKVNNQLFITVPLIPFPAFAQYLHAAESNATEFEEFETMTFPVDQIGKGNYVAFKVSGDSMNGGGIDDIPDRTIVLAREIGQHLWKDGFRKTNHGFVIVTNTNIMVKDIINQVDAEITCHSRNPSPEFTDFVLSLADVRKIFHVVKRVM